MREKKNFEFRKSALYDYLPLMIAFVLILLFFGVTTKHFFAVRNFLNILLYAANVGIMCCTMTLILVSGNIDLSIGSVIAFGGIVLGSTLQRGVPVGLAILATLAACTLTGVYNAIMITRIHVNAFITTLAGMQMFRGFAYLITGGKAINIGDAVIKQIGRGYLGPIPNAVIIMVLLVVLFAFISIYTLLADGSGHAAECDRF